MNKKRFLGIALVIAIFIGLAITIIYIFTELKDETDIQLQKSEITDAIKFKNEYEALNNTEVSENVLYRTVTIDDNNPIKYVKASDIVSKMDNKETFVVYFGFDSCPWCRLIIEQLISSAKEHNISTVYYIDIKNIRDKYELDSTNHTAVRTVEGTEGYYQLLNRFNKVLDDYQPLTYTETKKVKGKKKTVTNTVKVDEKRIYAPNVVLVNKGEPTILTTGINSKVTNPYVEPTEAEKEYTKNEFDKIFSVISDKTTTTSSNVCDEKGNC